VAIRELTVCDGCDNIILPGEVATIITKGILTDDGSVETVENSPLLHHCEDCSQDIAAELGALMEELQARIDAEAVA